MDFFMDYFKIKKETPAIIASVFFLLYISLLKEFVYVESNQTINWFSKYSS